MSDTPRFSATRFHHKFVAFSAVGVAMVCVPLVQVLQVQQADLQQLQASRALLDPVSAAVHTQYGLLTHGSLARQTLNGAAEIEPLRVETEQEVTARIGNLSAVLKEGAWGFAQAEARMLAEDWRALAAQVAQQRIDAPHSDAAHRLRVEQTLQVVDLVTLSQGPSDAAVSAQHAAWLASTRLLARLAADVDRPNPEPPLHTRLQTLREVLAGAVEMPAARSGQDRQGLNDTSKRSIDPAIAQAVDRVEDRSRDLLALRSPGAAKSAQAVARATVAAVLAQKQLFDTVSSAHQALLATQTSAVQRQRQWVLSTMAAMAAVAAALGMSLWSALRREGSGAEPPDPEDPHSIEPSHVSLEPTAGDGVPARRANSDPRERAAPRAEAGRLLQRLRGSAGGPARTEQPRLRDQEDSLPPPR